MRIRNDSGYYEGSSGLIQLQDPSEVYRPTPPPFELAKGDEGYAYRDYDNLDEDASRVKETYRAMHTNQTHEFAKAKRAEYLPGIIGEYSVMEVMDMLAHLVDESDPNTELSNDLHMYQTAERIREVHPDKPWFQLVGLVHDMGKILALQGEPQWAVVGDVWVTGCAPSKSVVFAKDTFKDNPDSHDPRYNTALGVYKEQCGLEHLVTSWGHDEYMYQVLTRNKIPLPDEALYIIRFHSFYPWHHGGDYMELCNEKDKEMLPWVQQFSSFDLYSKTDTVPDKDALRAYYDALIEQFCPDKLSW